MGGEQRPLSFRYAVSGGGEADAQLFMLVRPALSDAYAETTRRRPPSLPLGEPSY